jgi:hypothetical protein
MAGENKAPGQGGTGTGGTPPPATGAAATGAEGEVKSFTQEQMDAIIQDRLKKATAGRVSLEEFGLKSKDELQKLIDAQTAAEEKAKSDQDKALEEAKKAGRKEAETELMGKATARLVRSEFIAAAKDRNVVDPSALYLIAKGEGKLDGLTVNDADEVDGFDDAYWEELLKERPYMVKEGSSGGSTPPPPPGTGQKPPTPGNANAGSQGGTKVPEDRRKELLARYPALAKRR